MKTGFGSHCSPVKMLAPRSLTGQMKYFDRMRMLVKKKPRRIVQTHAPTKPGKEVSTSQLNESKSKLTLDSLLWTELNQLRLSKGDSTDICKDVVDDDQADRKEEPDHALEDIVHDEVRLHDDQIECHVCPGVLSELELVVSLLERANKEDEA